ncbi:MAG: hypothetical protein ACKVGT_10665 [Flavobacteriales bacterium]
MKNLFLISIFLVVPSLLLAQDKNDYTRSSLHLHLVDDFNFEGGNYVLKSYEKFYNQYFPENYNNHTIHLNKIRLENWELTDNEMESAGKKNSLLADVASQTVTESTGGVLKVQDNAMVKLQLDKYIAANKVAHELVKKWFAVKEDGSYSTAYIAARTLENQSVESAALTAVQDMQTDVLNKLISNTFVVFTRLYYLNNEWAAAVVRQATYKLAEEVPEILREAAIKKADKAYEKSSEGYSVWSTSWLYQLEWDQAKFDEYLSALEVDGEIMKVNLEKFSALNFKLNFLSQEKATSLVTFSLKKEDKDRSQDDIFDRSTIRNMDKVLFQLQKKNDVFKPLFPLREGFAIAAGMKEGLEGGETFDVLEIRNGEYKSIGTMKVDKKRVWNNSFEPGKDLEPGFTYFKKGSKKFVPGIHYVKFKN